MKAKIFGVAFAALLALGLAACSNMDSGSVNGMMLAMTAQPATKRTVSILVGGDVADPQNGISATVMPGYDVTTIDGAFKYERKQLTFVLTGKSHLGGEYAELIEPDNSTGSVALDLDAALWDLTLTAYPNDGFARANWTTPAGAADNDGTRWPDVVTAQAKTPALVATTSVDLRNGGQTVTFNLSATGLTGKGGDVVIAGKYVDKNVVTKYVVGLYGINDNLPKDVTGVAIAETVKDSISPSTSGTEVSFSGKFQNVAAGSYRAAVALYSANGTQVGYWSDIVVLNPTVPSINDNIYIDNLLEPPAPPTNLTAYLVPGSYDKKNDGYYQVRLVWEDNSTNENYFRIKLDRYKATSTPDYTTPAAGSAVAGTVYYEDNTGTLPTTQPAVGASVSGMFVAKTTDAKAASDTGFPVYLSPAAVTTGLVTDTKYTESPYYNTAFKNSSLLAGSQSVVLKLETGYIYEVKIVAHNAMGDSTDAVPGSDTTGVTTGAIWTERVAAGAAAKTIMEGLDPACPVDDSTPPATDPTKYMPYAVNDGTGLSGINLMSVKYLLGENGRKYTDGDKFVTGPLYSYFRYKNDTPVLSKQVASGHTDPDFCKAQTSVPEPITTVGDIATAGEFPIIVKLAGTTTSSAISDFAFWSNPTTAKIYDGALISASNVTVLARYGSSTTGVVTIEDLQDIDPARIKAQYSLKSANPKTAGTTIKPTDGDASGHIEESEFVEIDAKTEKRVYLAVDSATTSDDARTYTKFKFNINGNECYGTDNEYYFNTGSMESGIYHVLISAYYAPQDKWFGYEFSFKLKR